MSTATEENSKLSTTSQNEYLALGEVQRIDVPWYRPSLPQPLQPHIQHLFEAYVGLAPDEIASHIEFVRAKAWRIQPYPCIGMYTFIHTPMYNQAIYAEIVTRVKGGAKFLDVGTAFGQELRCLAMDGAPAHNMYAIDLSSDLWELGYLLFKDRERLNAKFIVADVLATNENTGELEALIANVDVIHTGSFFHLFDWSGQMKALKRLVGLTLVGALLVGHQTGREPAKHTSVNGQPRFYHDKESWQKMWNEVEEATATTWVLEMDVGGFDILGLKQDDFTWMGPHAKALRFVATRTG